MRRWLTSRCVLVVLMLIVAPGAALAHLLITWVPGKFALARLDREISSDIRQLEIECELNTRLRGEVTQLQQAAVHGPSGSSWLPARDRDVLFDRLASAFRTDVVSIEQLTFEQPGLYAAEARTNLLACERVTIRCTGDYAALTACLDRVISLDVPARCADLTWRRGDNQLILCLQLKVPFVPDEPLRLALADEAGLEESDEP